MFRFMKNKRRQRLREAPFPPDWLGIVERNFPLFLRLPEADQRELLGHAQVFLAEKHFEGCGGLDITDEIKVTIAAQACLLLLHRETDYYPLLSSILVYPAEYTAEVAEQTPEGIVDEGFDERIGETWSQGSVVLSWNDVQYDADEPRDGLNVTLHEFAHQIDEESGDADGTPVLEDRGRYETWARVMKEAYEQLRRDAQRKRPTVLDEYGAEDPAEFFAVATECFFEKPAELKRARPELYAELKGFYRQDPAEYFA
ncbi:MAG: zinc-dependent peptidase [Chitinivibrionia bacterium]|nr:zinc-dependent peptidase [Chitinivibrionia bacterium]